MKKYPLLQSQLGVFMECLKFPESTQYNLPHVVKLDASIDLDRLAEAWVELIKSKAVFRNRYEIDDNGNPLQWSDENMEIVIGRRKCTKAELDAYLEDGFVRPYDILSGEPLFHIEIAETEEGNFQLFDMHHTITDGFGIIKLVSKELDKFYKGKKEPVDNALYELAEQESGLTETPEYIAARKYFIEKFNGQEFVTLSNGDGSKMDKMLLVSSYVDKKICDDWCAENNIRIDMLFQIAFCHVMGALTRNKKLVYGTVYHGRNTKDKMKAAGMFVNTVPVLVDISDDLTIKEAAAKLQEELDFSFKHAVYPIRHLFADIHNFPKIIFNFRAGRSMATYYKINGIISEGFEMLRGKTQDDMDISIILSNGQYLIRIESSSAMNDHQTMEILGNAIRETVYNIIAAPDALLKDIAIISETEKAEIIKLSAGEKLEYNTNETWLDLFNHWVEVQPEHIAVADEVSSFTYSELDKASNAVAEYLLENGINTNDFVIVRMDRIKEFAAAAIGAQKAGAAYVPVDPAYPEERIKYMTENCEAKVTLTEELVKSVIAERDNVKPVKMYSPDTLAYMIYTSGSTGRPKGVVLHQRGLMNFTKGIMSLFELTSADRISSHRSFSFDAHIGDFYPTLSASASVHIMPEEIRRDPEQIYDFLIRNEITGGGYTTSIAKLLLTSYDLKQRFISCGGEALQGIKCDKVQIFNEYGPTECHDDITVCKLEKGRYYEAVPVGRPMANGYCFIVDKYNNLVPQGVKGEICYAGPQTGYGYWKLDDKTKEVFEACPFVDGVRMYHTGDIGLYNAEGNIEYVGRIDFQVKLNGFRIELGEIEGKALQYEHIRHVSAQVRKSQICLYYTADADVDESALKSFLSVSLAGYMVPTAYIQLDKMPLTPNGKVDRRALPDPEVKLEEIIAPATEMEKKVFTIAAEMLNKSEFGVTNNLVSLGMSSLAAMRLSAKLNSKLSAQVRVAEIMKNPTVRGIVQIIENSGDELQKIQHIADREYYPITENQRGIYIDWEMNQETTQYNIPSVFKFTDKNADKLAQAVKIAIDAHSGLKTRFVLAENDVMQQPHADEAAEVLVAVLDSEPDAEFFQSRVRPFDLLNDRLYRAEIYSCNEAVYWLMDIHHTLSDGLSISVLIRDILAAYDGKELKAEEITAHDFAVYESELAGSEAYTKAEEYYNNLVSDAVAVSYNDSKNADGVNSATIDISIEAAAIDAVCAKNGVTVSSYLNAAFAEALSRITREETPLYLTVSNGREADARLSECVGMFVKTLPVVLNTKNHSKESVAEYVKNFHNQLQNTIENDFYPYTKLVEKYGIHGEIMFVYQGGILEGSSFEGVEIIPVKLDTTKLPITVTTYPLNGKYVISIEYDGMRYSKADMKLLAKAVGNAAESMAVAKKISDVKLVTAEEENVLVELGHGPVMERDQSGTIISIFKKRVKETPAATAVVFKDKSYTYAELDKITDNLAVYLKKKYDIKAEENVGVLINRSELMLIYPLAIMKNGAAYMPLDPHFPTNRLSFMCDDASVKVILSEGRLLEEKLPEFAGNSFNSSELNDIPEATTEEINALTAPQPDNRMVVLFTSGSTGVPKAVELEQHSIANFCYWYAKDFEITANDKVSAYANFGFDAHMMDIYPAIFAGAAVYILPDEMRKDLQLVNEYMESVGITVSFFTTQVGCLIKDMNKSLRLMSVGGEKLPLTTAPAYRFVNGYGPTECSIYTATCDVEGTADGTYIGRPLANYQLYVIDQNCHLVPRGMAGELLIAGEGVARGYMNRPELTAEKFIIFKPSADSEPVRAYRSGDLVRWAANGNIQYLGRIDRQVKIRGLRIELGEIENRAASFAGIKQVAVDVKNDQLCCYYVTNTKINKADFKAHLAEKLTEFMVPEIYIPLDKMPLNANGKLDRKTLPEPKVQLEEVVTPVTEIEKNIFNIAAEQLGNNDFGITNNLITLGMTSLGAMRLSAAINTKFNIRIKVTDIMKNPTVHSIAGLVDQMTVKNNAGTTDDLYRLLKKYKGNKADAAKLFEQLYQLYPNADENQNESIIHTTDKEYYPITENQRGIYIDWEMNRNTTQYNIPSVYKFTDKDADKLAEAVKKAINTHSGLKTRFALIENDVVQIPHYDEAAEVLVAVLDNEPNKEFFQNRVKSFNLLNDRLYRIEIYSCKDAVYLFMDIHHTLYDGLSASVLVKDILAAYDGRELKTEEITAYDFAVYENELINSDDYVKAENYYDVLIAEATAASYTDSRQADGTRVGTLEVSIDGAHINAACAKYGVTVSSYLNAAFAEVLQRITREENPLYLTISNGREADTRLSECVGMFVKTLPVVLRTENHGTETIAEYVKDFHHQLQNTIENDFYPYTKIVEKHGLKGEIMFVYQGGIFDGSSINGVDTIPFKLDTVKLPITVTAYPLNGKYVISVEYDGMRYSRADMELLANTVGNMAINMAAAEKIRDVKMVTEVEENALAELGHGPVMERDQSETIISIFKKRVKETPAATAVVFKDKSYTYAELDKITDNLAVYLKKKYDIKAEENVGVLINRSELMLIYPLAIMKNGAAYMPLDPHFPTDRLSFMCDDASVKVILSEGNLLEEKLPEFAGNKFNSSELNNIPEATAEEVAELTFPEAHNRLVIIFTSGSTGKPKAVDLEHYGVVNYCHWYVSEFGLTMADHVAGYANFGFDAHMIDFYPSILAGAAVYIFDEAMRMDVNGMNAYMEENNISVAFMTTQIGCIIKDINHSLRYLSTGGEKMPPVTPPDFRFLNVYGPTECSLFSTYYDVKGYFEGEYIGYPLANYQLYVVDQNCQLVPRGVAGELLITGEGVARGYMNRPELTAEKFIMFKPTADSEPIRAYRSGDLVRWSESDGIQFLGRIDKQVKLRGLRIELGEIENRAASFAGIKQVAVDVRNEQLCCYYVSSSTINKELLKAHLAEKLTDFMVPEIYIPLDKMPLNANGKIDRKTLPEPEIIRSTEYIAPKTEAEIVVAESMQKILGMKEKVGALDNFLELGGDSIKAIRMISLLRQKGFTLLVSDIMKLKVVRSLAAKAQKTDSNVKISQEPFEGKVQDTAIVKFFKYLNLKEPNHFNQSMLFKWKERPDMELLQKALNAVVKHHDMLRAVIKEDYLYVRSAATTANIMEYDEKGKLLNDKEN